MSQAGVVPEQDEDATLIEPHIEDPPLYKGPNLLVLARCHDRLRNGTDVVKALF